MQYPPQIAIAPLTRAPRGTIRVPGSKSITNRALALAAQTARQPHYIVLDGVLHSEDTEVMVQSLHCLGFLISADWNGARILVHAWSDEPTMVGDLSVANSGTSMRFLTALVSLRPGRYRLDGVPRMRERPIGDLLDALNQLGVKATSEFGNGCPPVIIESNGLRGGTVHIRGDTSSQFLSGLLMAAPFAQTDLDIEVEGSLVSVPYVTMTLAMMRQFGLTVEQD